MGNREPWLMARWKARVELLLSVIELLFLSLGWRRYKAKCLKTRCRQEGVVGLEVVDDLQSRLATVNTRRRSFEGVLPETSQMDSWRTSADTLQSNSEF